MPANGADWGVIPNGSPLESPGDGYDFPLFADETTIDEKGRITIPVRHKEFILSLPDKELVAVTITGKLALVYPRMFYKQFAKQFEAWAKANPKEAPAARTNLNFYGCDVAIDAADRLLLPLKLRDKVGLNGKHKLCIAWVKGRLELNKSELYAQPSSDPVALDAAINSLDEAGIL